MTPSNQLILNTLLYHYISKVSSLSLISMDIIHSRKLQRSKFGHYFSSKSSNSPITSPSYLIVVCSVYQNVETTENNCQQITIILKLSIFFHFLLHVSQYDLDDTYRLLLNQGKTKENRSIALHSSWNQLTFGTRLENR